LECSNTEISATRQPGDLWLRGRHPETRNQETGNQETRNREDPHQGIRIRKNPRPGEPNQESQPWTR